MWLVILVSLCGIFLCWFGFLLRFVFLMMLVFRVLLGVFFFYDCLVVFLELVFGFAGLFLVHFVFLWVGFVWIGL